MILKVTNSKEFVGKGCEITLRTWECFVESHLRISVALKILSAALEILLPVFIKVGPVFKNARDPNA